MYKEQISQARKRKVPKSESKDIGWYPQTKESWIVFDSVDKKIIQKDKSYHILELVEPVSRIYPIIYERRESLIACELDVKYGLTNHIGGNLAYGTENPKDPFKVLFINENPGGIYEYFFWRRPDIYAYAISECINKKAKIYKRNGPLIHHRHEGCFASLIDEVENILDFTEKFFTEGYSLIYSRYSAKDTDEKLSKRKMTLKNVRKNWETSIVLNVLSTIILILHSLNFEGKAAIEVPNISSSFSVDLIDLLSYIFEEVWVDKPIYISVFYPSFYLICKKIRINENEALSISSKLQDITKKIKETEQVPGYLFPPQTRRSTIENWISKYIDKLAYRKEKVLKYFIKYEHYFTYLNPDNLTPQVPEKVPYVEDADRAKMLITLALPDGICNLCI